MVGRWRDGESFNHENWEVRTLRASQIDIEEENKTNGRETSQRLAGILHIYCTVCVYVCVYIYIHHELVLSLWRRR